MLDPHDGMVNKNCKQISKKKNHPQMYQLPSSTVENKVVKHCLQKFSLYAAHLHYSIQGIIYIYYNYICGAKNTRQKPHTYSIIKI